MTRPSSVDCMGSGSLWAVEYCPVYVDKGPEKVPPSFILNQTLPRLVGFSFIIPTLHLPSIACRPKDLSPGERIYKQHENQTPFPPPLLEASLLPEPRSEVPRLSSSW